MAPTMARRGFPAWGWALGVGVASVAVYFLLPKGGIAQANLYVAVHLAAGVTILVGARVLRPKPRAPWVFIGLSQLMVALADLVWNIIELGFHEEPFPSVADVFYLGAYPFMILGVLALVRIRVRDRTAGIDSTIISITLGVLAWMFFIGPQASDASASVLARVVGIAYPAIDLVLVGVAARLAFGAGRGVPAHRLLLWGLVLNLAADVGFDLTSLSGDYVSGHWIDALFLLCSVFFVAALLHASSRRLDDVRVEAPSVSRWRLLLLAGALLLLPMAVWLEGYTGRQDRPVIIGSAVVVIILAMIRVASLHRQVERGLLREVEERSGLLADAEERFRRSFEDAPVGMALLTVGGRFLQVNEALCAFVGRSQGELLRDGLRAVTHPRDTVDIDAARGPAGRPVRVEARFLRPDGTEVWGLVSASVAHGRDGFEYVIAQIQDITDRKRFEEELTHRALHDRLTELPNRALFVDRVSNALARTSRARPDVAVMHLDLDHFRVVNDGLGHELGDELLILVAARLTGALRPGDSVARLGGDEFAILCEGASEKSAVEIAERIASSLTEPFRVDGREIFTTASIGIAMAGGTDRDPLVLLRGADAAMNRAKQRGRNRHEIFEEGLHAGALARLELERDLRQALERDEFRLHFQPVVNLATGRMDSMEALIRWQRPGVGLVGPGAFIPAAEESDLIEAIGGWVLGEACRVAAAGVGRDGSRVSINLSARQLAQPNLVEVVDRVLRESGAPPEAITLEITESTLMADPPAAVNTLSRLRGLGVSLAIDDFGTGLSSLGYLKDLPHIDVLKIDRAFIVGLGETKQAQAILRGVVTMGHALGMWVVAEGVETLVQLHELIDMGCDAVQGFVFARPCPLTEVEALRSRDYLARPSVALAVS